MFDSPFDFCPRCDQMVLLDQTLKECIREHLCDGVKPCPLESYFSGLDFSTTLISFKQRQLHQNA
jgi:hypothetical protein